MDRTSDSKKFSKNSDRSTDSVMYVVQFIIGQSNDSYKTKSKDGSQIALLGELMDTLIRETLRMVIDLGCTKTKCWQVWLDCYLQSVSSED